jgi:hypothetical protein
VTRGLERTRIAIHAILILFAVSILQKPALQSITVALRNLVGSQN